MTQTEPIIRYTCVVGHVIPAELLETATEVQVLDRGAEVRLCREHGTPIAVRRSPGTRENDDNR